MRVTDLLTHLRHAGQTVSGRRRFDLHCPELNVEQKSPGESVRMYGLLRAHGKYTGILSRLSMYGKSENMEDTYIQPVPFRYLVEVFPFFLHASCRKAGGRSVKF